MQRHQFGASKGPGKAHQEQGLVAGGLQRLLLVQRHQHLQQHIFGDGLDGALPGSQGAADAVHGGLDHGAALDRGRQPLADMRVVDGDTAPLQRGNFEGGGELGQIVGNHRLRGWNGAAMLEVVPHVVGVGPFGGFGLRSGDETLNRVDWWRLRRFGALGNGRYRQGCACRSAWFFTVHFDFDNGALSLPIGSDKKAVRRECGTAE